MGLLNSLKGAASKVVGAADQKLGKFVDKAAEVLVYQDGEKDIDLSAILNPLVFDEGKYDKAISICEQYLYDDDVTLSAQSYFYRAVCNYCKALEIDIEPHGILAEEEREAYHALLDERWGLLESALDDAETSLKISEDNALPGLIRCNIHYKTCILDAMNRREEARRWAILDMKSSVSGFSTAAKDIYEAVTNNLLGSFNQYLTIDDDNLELRKLFEEDGYPQDFIENEIKDQERLAEEGRFTNHYTFGERQFIFVVKSLDKIAGCFDREEIINWVFTLDKMPRELIFPVGHPQANTLYVAHPAQKGVYLPYEGAEEQIFHEKVEDFCRLAQCLGATEIAFRSIKGETVSEGFSQRLSVGGSVGVKGISVGSEFSRNQSGSHSIEQHKEVGYSYSLQPKQAYVPTDLNWLDIDKSWQSFVKQRMEGNILSYTKRISSSEAVNISNCLQMSAKASFENLMANVNGNYSIERDTTFSHNQSSEWEIRIQFASLDELEQNGQAVALQQTEQIAAVSDKETLTEAEEKYKEEVLFILEDGEITETERRFLERKRIKLGLSEEQAAKVEALCVPTLSDADKEYLEIYKEIVGDAPITDRKRRMLNREAESLGLSDERVRDLEETVNVENLANNE